MKLHKCKNCGTVYEIEDHPSFTSRVIGKGKAYIPLDKAIFITCPNCGKNNWADERRFVFGLFGPRIYVALVFFVTSILLSVAILEIWNALF